MSPIFLFRFGIWRDFKNKSDICHVFCEESFMIDIAHSQIDVERELYVVSLILIFFINFSFEYMIFGILQVSRDRERLLLSDVLPCAAYFKKGH